MRYNKKKVLFLLVPLLIIIFFSGNATADTYSFSAGSTFGDVSGHLDDLSPPEEPIAGGATAPHVCVRIESSPEGANISIDEESIGVTPSNIYFDRPGNHTFKLDLDEYQTYEKSLFISESRTLDVILEPLSKETPTLPTPPTPVPEPSEVFEKNQKTNGNTTKVYKEESLTKSKSKSSSAFFHPSPTPPGFLAIHILIAIFIVYFFTFKNKR